MVELNGVRIWAVGWDDEGRALPPRKLVCGTLARSAGPAPAPWGGAEVALPARIPVPGRPDAWVGWTGWFELVATGARVAVYGAVVESVGADQAAELGGESAAGRL